MRLYRDSLLVFVLGVCLLALPLTSLVHVIPAVADANADLSNSVTVAMPCHHAQQAYGQQTEPLSLHICPETGLAGCQCCDHAGPMGLSTALANPAHLPYLTGQKGLQYLQTILTRPQLPPYRPPRLYA